MKKLLTIFLILYGSYAMAQNVSSSSSLSVRINGYTTYAFDDNNVNSYYSTTSYFEGQVKGGFQYGGSVEIMPFPLAGVELTYLRLDSEAPMEYYNSSIQYTNFELAQNWLLLSFNKYVPIGPKVEPYAGMQAGMQIATVTNPTNQNESTATKFAWGIKAGLNVWASESVGIKIQAGLLSAVQSIGGGLYFGTGGTGAGASAYSTYYQFNLGGGLVFKLH